MSKRYSHALAGLALAGSLAIAACDSTPEPTAEPEAVTDVAIDDISEADRSGSAPGVVPPLESPVDMASSDPIRGPGGLEERCLARIAQETGARVNGTNRIEESEAAIEIYANVEGAEAPWKCLGNKDGSISEVTYTGSEGNL